MAMRNSHRLSLRAMGPFKISRQFLRNFHKDTRAPSAPSPTPFVPDVQTFLSLIGRGMSKYASKLPSWEKLFSMSSTELRELGIEPSRQRRYLLRKREKFRHGIYGPGGDLENVVDGVAQLRIVEVPFELKDSTLGKDVPRQLTASATLTPGMRRVVVNIPPDATDYTYDPSKPLKKFAHMKINNGSIIQGPFLQPLKGSNGRAALIKAQEGMWEDKLGHKVDGGERRRAEVRAKKRSEERKKEM
ncbi:IGR protein domain-containing protein [Aspergillus ellipticus CBS 707.79]|uniref:Small ribosomal subunit protein mS41 n=1 Tax=Aspergillus ellipticus CBS 707.79 TaxID=1448320 RepID=A0A319DJD2_9EURO|nr:IGR protein domain-containing protein [Aspergillus ellipticus CBS 707.79]